MGLDISAYSQAKKAARQTNNTWHLYKDKDMDRAPEIEEGEYLLSGESHDFCAGSYSGYNSFRRMLSEAIVGVSPQTIWQDPDKFDGSPLVELINFSDCEGFFGPSLSEKLAKDFKDNRSKFEKFVKDSVDSFDVDYYVRKYDDWTKGFEVAAKGGVLIFH